MTSLWACDLPLNGTKYVGMPLNGTKYVGMPLNGTKYVYIPRFSNSIFSSYYVLVLIIQLYMSHVLLLFHGKLHSLQVDSSKHKIYMRYI